MKKSVHYSVLEDMKKYIKNFNPEEYERSVDSSDPSVIEYLREYYDNHLPVDVTAWIRANKPEERLIYGKGLGEQVCFVRDVICELFWNTYEELEANLPMVISTHYSKSVKLPVYQIDLKKYGVEMVLRYNFYDWKVSIKSDIPIDIDWMGLFKSDEVISSVYCEGFPEDKVYGSYEQNHSQFTVEIRSKYNLYVFMFLLSNYLKVMNEK